MYNLVFTNQSNLLSSSDQRTVESIYSIITNNDNVTDITVCIRQGEKLIGYKYVGLTGSWQHQWNETVFSQQSNYLLNSFPWLVTDTLLPNKNIIVLRNRDGIHFYQVEQSKPGLKLLKEDRNFHEVYNYDRLLLGKFYPNADLIGVMTRDTRGEIKFYAATADSFLPDEPDPLFPLTTQLSFSDNWRAADSDFFLTKLRRNNSELIGLRTAKGLEFYQFTGDYILENVLNASKIAKSVDSYSGKDHLFLADLTHQLYQDILYLNKSGLHIYQYNNQQEYEFIHRNTDFAESHGWIPNYSDSIKFTDLNNDGRDDLIFTGHEGLTALTFDYDAKSWKKLLNSNQLPQLQRYSNVVSTLPVISSEISHPSLFIQDTDGKLQWAKLEYVPITTTEIPITRASFPPTTINHDSLVEQNNHVIVPTQIARTYLAEKPILRWAEQWDSSFLKESVDIASGQVNLNIPLIDISSVTGWNLDLTLSYCSQVTESDLLGVGWSLPLAQHYIFVDFSDSNYPGNARYYLMIGGRPQPLKQIPLKQTNEKSIQLFQLAENDEGTQITIEYNEADQRWVIEDLTEQAIYGKANCSIAKDVLQWSLSWPNWHGPGLDKISLQPLISAWYLNKRFDKNRQQALYYYYEIDSDNIDEGKSYSSAVRLKTISDNQQMHIILDYASKKRNEYTVGNPVDDQGNIVFPVPLTQPYFVQGCYLSTAAYTQSLKFIYQLDNGKRLLTAIKQQLLIDSETILQFSYQHLLEITVIKSCKLVPRELMINFNYESITPPPPTIVYNNILKYPVREKPKIAYGSNYAIMAYQDPDPKAGKVNLRIMNREMTRIITNCALDKMISCPSLSPEIKDYTLHAYHNSFAVFLEGDQNRVLFIFNYYKDNWSRDSAVYDFSKKALVRFSRTVIVAAEPNENKLKLFERTDHHSSWKTTPITIPQSITYIALHQRLVVVYDDLQLRLFYHTPESGWQSKVLESSIVGLTTINRSFVENFDLSPAMKEQLSLILNQNSLQILDNSILLSTLKESDGQVFSKIRLFLLDSRYKVVKQQTFKIQGEYIYQKSKKFDGQNGDIIYHLGYVKEGHLIKVRAKNISGNAIETIGNKNKRQDKIEEVKKSMNENPEFQKNAKEIFLLDWNLYNVQITPRGVYCGNDTLLRFTGTKWEKESVPNVSMVLLGKYFVLEPDNDNKSLFRLYKQGSDQNKQGQALKELQLHSSGQLINRYPAYIAYHPQPNLVKVLTFNDEKTLGQIHKFRNEQLLPESDWQNLVTLVYASSATILHAEPQECLVRPASTLVPSKPQLFVSQIKLTDSEVQRLTGYQRSFDNNKAELTFSETVTMIPGDTKSLHGWYEATMHYHVNSGNATKTEHWFDARGRKVLGPPEEESVDKTTNAATDALSPMLLLDRSARWLISDFSPFNLNDEMVAYYGFESYEGNQIGALSSNTTEVKTWHIDQAKIVKGHFAFTGENYLQLNSSGLDTPSFLEGVFQPRNQDTTYLAACWIRCSSKSLTLNKAVSYLKAILSTSSREEIIGLMAQAKQRLGDWFYLELPINFQLVEQIYQDYVKYAISNNLTTTPSENATFRITLRVEAPIEEIVDLDHIRFAPFTHDFQATVYHPLTGKVTETIQGNGLVIRNVLNRLQQQIGTINEDGQVTHLSSSSRTGKLVPAPQGSILTFKPNILTFEPEYGSYETFDAYSLRNRWSIDSPAAWNTAPKQLWHTQPGEDLVKASKYLFDSINAAIRFHFALQGAQSSLSLIWQGIGSLKLTRQLDKSTNLLLPNGNSIGTLPSVGELIIMLEQNYIWLWLDGVLLVDQALPISLDPLTPWSSFALKAKDKVLVEDFITMNHPEVKMEYYNAFGEKTQVIQLEDAKTAQISEILYDELGREAITTKTTRINRNANQSLLTYRLNFASNKNPADLQSVWHTGKLEGEVNLLNSADEGFAYTRTKYAPNPLNQEKILGLPGEDFSITGRYATTISQYSNLAFLDNLFPTNQGYRQNVEHTSNGSVRIAVFDRRNNQVAKYVRVPSFDHLLSTYEYDSENRLIKILSPLYHEKVNTAIRLTAWQAGDENLSSQEQQWQDVLGTHFVYDKYGHLIRKITPDDGTTKYLYNSAGQMRFMVSLGSTDQPLKIVYFTYDNNNQLISTGHIKQPLSLTALHQHVESDYLPDKQEYQQFDYSDDHLDPLLRGRIKDCITYNEGELIAEKLYFNSHEQIIKINLVTTFNQLTEIKKQYLGNKMNTLIYPMIIDGQPLRLVHSYNRLGQLVGLGTSTNPTEYASFTYYATGQLASEQYRPNVPHSFTRSYQYNSPGFLEQISDPFLLEKISYTKNGYGQAGYGDGMVMELSFNASWPVNADPRWFQVEENNLTGNYSTICIQALKRTGYLTSNGKPIKLYVRDVETTLPLVCGGKTGRNIAKLIAEKQTPSYYGHRYAYGNHQELVKAKYFTSETEPLTEPLQPDSFAKEILSLTIEQSRDIWQLLAYAGYIITDQRRNNLATAIGKRGKSFFRDIELNADLANLNDNYTLYLEPIKKLIILATCQRKTITLAEFETSFLHWRGLDYTSPELIYNWQRKIAKKIGQMLINKRYLSTQTSDFSHSLHRNFTTTLHQYTNFIPEIVNVLSQHFAHELGGTAFDVESYQIDANGNHQLFYTGFNRYELAYRNATNQIQNIKVDRNHEAESEKSFAMKHDEQGNVIEALHKNIQHIKYHPVSQRTTFIQLADGRSLRFYYDAQGERVLKRVFDIEGKVSHETHYLLDEQGRVLMDWQTKYLPESTKKITTAYLYGPRGLLGFIRDNNFYSVTTDHAGSIRLVTKNNQVVAAYDYLPYGQLMRSYGTDLQAHIVYRYTGQEWDEETGLYNYHARLYDPGIGRFYQPDPKAQYFSPYKYAGNSPISVIDPDGELAFLLICVILGAYLGGAATNDRWNPVDWDFKDQGTWYGIGGGAIAGGFLKVGFVASVATFGVGTTIGSGLGVAYITTASTNQNINPLQWKWDRPGTWSSVFQGFGTGSGIAGGIGVAHRFANSGKSLTSLGKLLGVDRNVIKTMFLTVSYTAGGGIAYGGGVIANNGTAAFWQWDWSNPSTYSALVDGFDSGMGWPQNFLEIGRGFGKMAKNSKKVGNLLKNPSKRQALTAILKNPKHPLYKVTGSVVMAYYMGSAANGELDITKWNLASFSTYEGVINGVLFGKDTSNMLKLAHSSKGTKPSNALIPVIKNKVSSWTKKLGHILDNIQISRKWKEYQHLIKLLFSSETVWRSKLQQLTDKPASLMKDAENFFKLGLENWKSKKKRPPEIVQRLLDEASQKVEVESSSSELVKWQTEAGELAKRQQEVFPDKDADFLNCKRVMKHRKRRAVVPSTSGCFLGSNTQEFTKNPTEFLESYPISTLSTQKKFMDNRITLENGAIFNFILEKSEGSGYNLAPALKEDNNVIQGYWLSTSGVGKLDDPSALIEINLDNPKAKYIFTVELQGCSICIRVDHNRRTMKVFHYNRPRLGSLYINNYEGTNKVEGQNKYINDDGKDIPELADGVVVDANNNNIEAIDNIITIDKPLYKRLNNGQLERIKTINGENILDIINKNQPSLLKENKLIEDYDIVIQAENDLQHPQNYALRQIYGKLPHTYPTPILYKYNDNEWRFVSKKIPYPADRIKTIEDNVHKIREGFTIENSDMHVISIPISPRARTDIDALEPAAVCSPFRIRGKRSLDWIEHYENNLYANSFYITPFAVQTEKSTNLNTQINHFDAASSGASMVQFWPIRAFKGVTTIIGNAMEYWSSENALKSPNLLRIVGHQVHANIRDYNRMSNFNYSAHTDDPVNIKRQDDIICVPYIWDKDSQEYVTKYVAGCTLPQGQVKVFGNIHQDHITVQSADYHISGDTYKNCRPIEFESIPSLYCEGIHTNIVYTTNVQLPTPSLDAVNAQLMLARVFGIDKLMGELITRSKIFLGLEQDHSNQDHSNQDHRNQDQEESNPKDVLLVKITAQQFSKWQDSIEEVESLITTLSSQAHKVNNEQNLNWAEEARLILQDRVEEVKDLSKQQSLVNAEEIIELDKKLQYLQIELEESMQIDLEESINLPSSSTNPQQESAQNNDQQEQRNSRYSYLAYEHLVRNISLLHVDNNTCCPNTKDLSYNC